MDSPIPEHTLKYRADIDGLRAVAVLGVLIYHAFPRWLPGGFFGVDVFFVISGFLITSLIAKQIDRGEFTFLGFYKRRALRLFPGLLTVLAVVVVFGWFADLPQQFSFLGKSLLSSSAFVANIYFLRQGGYFDSAALAKPLLHLWSLGVEEQFYIFFPVFMILTSRRSSLKKALLVLVTLVSFAYCLWLTYQDPPRAFYLPGSRVWELLIGSICAAIFSLGGRFQSARAVGSWAGLALILGSMWFVDESMLLPGYLALVPTIGAALIVLGAPERAANRLLSLRPVVFVGLISYALYLWHWPLLAINYKIAEAHPSAVSTVLCLILAVVLAVLTRQLIETPLRFSKRSSQTALGLGSGLFAFFLVGVVVWLMKGVPQRFDSSIRPYVAIQNMDFDAAVRSDVCHLQHVGLEARAPECIETKRPLIALWGDSHAAALYPGLATLKPSAGFGLTQLTEAGCPPILGLTRTQFQRKCDEINQDAFRKLVSNAPDVVFIDAAWSHEQYGLTNQETAEMLGATLDKIKSALPRARVVVFGPAPRWQKPVQEVIYDFWRTHGHGVPSEKTDFELRTDVLDLEPIIKSVATSRGANFISVEDAFCQAKQCVLTVGPSASDMASFDDWHLTPAASNFLISAQRSKIVGALESK